MSEDFEIQEPSEYQYNKEQVYSHSQLVMSALKDCKDNRAKEMRDGYYQIKFDRLGNAHRVWVPDSRLQFIESVESLMMIQERDYDPEVKERIKEIKEGLDKKWKELCELEEKDWKEMPHEIKKIKYKEGFSFMKDQLSEGMPYLRIYIRYKINFYTQIVSEIQKLIKRLYDYQEEIYEG